MLWALAVLAVMGIGGASLYFGDLNQDEGWYLYAARLVTQGQLPFIDFATTQMPVMPFAYALANPVVEVLGVAGGRLVTFLLGFTTMLGAAWLAARLSRQQSDKGVAALAVFILVGINLFQVYFFTIVKTYALGGLLLVAGLMLLSVEYKRSNRWAPFFAAVLLVMATGTRLSAGFVLPVVLLGMVLRRSEANHQATIGFILGAVLAAAALFLPFAMRAPEAFWFALVEYHAGREVGGVVPQLAYKAGFLIRLVRDYFVAISLATGLLLWVIWRRAAGREAEGASTEPTCPLSVGMLWGSVLLVSLVHVAAPFPYDDYQAMIYPLFGVAVVVSLMRRLQWHAPAQSWAVTCLLVVSMAGVAASPILEGWFVGPRDRIWWPMKARAPLRVLQDTADHLRDELGMRPGDTLLTQDPYLAVEAGMTIPHGLELGPFSYFPGWTRERAEARHVVNREMLEAILRTSEADVAAFSGYGFAIELPAVRPLPEAEHAALWSLLRSRYRDVMRVQPFGQADTELTVLKAMPAHDQ